MIEAKKDTVQARALVFSNILHKIEKRRRRRRRKKKRKVGKQMNACLEERISSGRRPNWVC
jgi:hypothetical protein